MPYFLSIDKRFGNRLYLKIENEIPKNYLINILRRLPENVKYRDFFKYTFFNSS